LGTNNQRDSIESVILKLSDQADFMKKKIEEFEFIPIWRLRDIKLNERNIKKYIKETWYNILAYHPDTYKPPKVKHEFSILTSNQASSLLEHKNEYRSTGSSTNPFKFSDKQHKMSKSMSKPFDKNQKFRSTMPTVREYAHEDNLKRWKTSNSHRKFSKGQRDLQILELAERIKTNNLNFKGKQTENMPLPDKIRHLSKMIDCNFNHYSKFLHKEKSKSRKRSKGRHSRSVAR